MKLKLEGGGRRAPEWLWLHLSAGAREQDGERSNQILLEQHLVQRDAGSGEWTTRMVGPKLRGHSIDRWWLRNQVLVELWQETLGDDAYLAFYGAVRVDLKQWRDAAWPQTSTRWYRINDLKTKGSMCTGSEDTFTNIRPSVDTNAMYLKLQWASPPAVKATAAPVVSGSINSETQPVNAPMTAPVQPGAFHFVIPNKPVHCSRKLKSIRVGEILHQGKVEYLRDFLPTTMYSRVRAREDGNAHVLEKALCLLQMSCQYAMHCTQQLDSNTRLLVEQRTMQAERIEWSRRKNARLQNRRRNLQRELHTVDTTQAGFRAMLGELDPICLAQCQSLLDEDCAGAAYT